MATNAKPQRGAEPVEGSAPAADDKVAVTFSVEHTTRDAVEHKRDSTAALSRLEARHVVHIGHGRYADAPNEAESADNMKEQGR